MEFSWRNNMLISSILFNFFTIQRCQCRIIFGHCSLSFHTVLCRLSLDPWATSWIAHLKTRFFVSSASWFMTLPTFVQRCHQQNYNDGDDRVTIRKKMKSIYNDDVTRINSSNMRKRFFFLLVTKARISTPHCAYLFDLKFQHIVEVRTEKKSFVSENSSLLKGAWKNHHVCKRRHAGCLMRNQRVL